MSDSFAVWIGKKGERGERGKEERKGKRISRNRTPRISILEYIYICILTYNRVWFSMKINGSHKLPKIFPRISIPRWNPVIKTLLYPFCRALIAPPDWTFSIETFSPYSRHPSRATPFEKMSLRISWMPRVHACRHSRNFERIIMSHLHKGRGRGHVSYRDTIFRKPLIGATGCCPFEAFARITPSACINILWYCKWSEVSIERAFSGIEGKMKRRAGSSAASLPPLHH